MPRAARRPSSAAPEGDAYGLAEARLVVRRHRAVAGTQLCRRVAHHERAIGPVEQIEIVVVVADGHALERALPRRLAQPEGGSGLVDPAREDLDPGRRAVER